jgi:RHH-type proline utilization regulon transcriptional repressor/proline dehydrogenase/delta 1-pyrroline-5-carboxylate dehydrogenase
VTSETNIVPASPAAPGGAVPGGAAEGRLEEAVTAIGRRIARAYPPPLRHPARALDQRAMQLVSGEPRVQAAIFRFVDATPACRTPQELADHLTALLDEVEEPPPLLRAPGAIGRGRLGAGLVGTAAAAAVRHIAQRFIVGASPHAALGHLRTLWDEGATASLDLLGEATVTAEEADRYAARCADAVMVLANASREWPERPILERDSHGALPRANVSVKVSALTPLLRPHAPERGREDAAARLRPLLHTARAAGAHLHVDMESVDTQEATLDLVLDLLAEEEFREGPSTGLVVQAYLRESECVVDRLLEWASAHPRAVPLTIRLVKGAYWDHEVAEARQRGWSPPVFTEKADSDRNFERLTRRLLDARRLVRLAVGSHNLRSVAHALAYNRLIGGSDADVEVQVLQGLGDDLRDALAHEGLRVRVYCPVGELVEGMAYLVRRLLENTASTSFLRAHGRGAPLDELLRAP